jgi:hypothetical protein
VELHHDYVQTYNVHEADYSGTDKWAN